MYNGIYTAIATLFNEDGSLDWDANQKLISNLIDAGVDGALFLGSTGEFFNMSLTEKKDYLSRVADYAGGKMTLLAGTGGMDIRETIELTGHARTCGFDASVVMCPYYFNLPESHIRDYFSRVAQRVDMDMLLYNFPARNQVVYSPEMILSLIGEYENIVGIKDSSTTLENTRRYINEVKKKVDRFSVLSGFDEYLLPNIMGGGDGTLGALPNVEPELFVRMFRAIKNGDMEMIRQCQDRVNRLMALYGVTDPFIAGIKYAISEKVVKTHPAMRFSRVVITPEQMARVKEIIGD